MVCKPHARVNVDLLMVPFPFSSRAALGTLLPDVLFCLPGRSLGQTLPPRGPLGVDFSAGGRSVSF